MADLFSESFKQAKAPWLSREVFPLYGQTHVLLSELFKNYHEYGSSPFAAIGATEHVFSQNPAKAKIIREAKMKMQATAVNQQANSKPANETATISKEDRAEILLTAAGILQQRVEENERGLQVACDEAAAAYETIPTDANAIEDCKEREKAWWDEYAKFQSKIQIATERRDANARMLATRAFSAEDMREATKIFREVQRSMDACLEATTPTEEKALVAEETPINIWISLVRCLVLEHKEQSTVEVNFTMTFSTKEMDGLRSIVQSEVTGEYQNAEAESLLEFTTRLQSKEKLANWTMQMLLAETEINAEKLRADGALFRTLKKNLTTDLSWAADAVQQQASMADRKGGMFQHLVSKIYETLQDSDARNRKQTPQKKGVTFAAIKGNLEKSPNARITKEERTATSATQVKTTFKPKSAKRKLAEESDAEEEEEPLEGRAAAVHFLDTQIGDRNSLDNLVGIIRGLSERVDTLTQNTSTTARQKAVCFQFQNRGKCERTNCTFAHGDGQGRQSPGPAYQPQRPRYEQNPQQQQQEQQTRRQQHQQPQQQQQECNDFKRGTCSRTSCRFSHGSSGTSNGREYRPSIASEAQKPSKACNRMWNESSCGNPRCTWEHGRCAVPGTSGVCNMFRERKHCPHIFSHQGCRFTHAEQKIETASGANTVPLGNAIPQRASPAAGDNADDRTPK